MKELDLLRSGGVVGGGGAGFPLWRKLSAPAKTLLINGAECEPLLKSDQYLMREYPDRLILAAERLGKLIGAGEAVICLKDHYHSQIRALQSALGKGGFVRLHLLPTVYPIGDEQAVVHSATGRVVPPGGLPGQVGCTVVSVSTALNALRALEGKPVTTRLLTVAGEVKRPGLYWAPIGMPVSLVLKAAGGTSREDCRLILGGPMMGALNREGEDPPVTKTLGGVLALPKEHPLICRLTLPMEQARNRAKSVCIQCRTCTDLCPRYLTGHPIYPHLSMRAYAMGQSLEPSALLCMECGVCELYACPMGLSPRRVQQAMKAALREKGVKPAFQLREAPPMAPFRQAPSGRVAAKISVTQYDFETPDQAVRLETPLACIPLKQHIGAAAQPVKSAGDQVRRGDPIAVTAPGTLGADIHASICGRITRADGDLIVIQGEA